MAGLSEVNYKFADYGTPFAPAPDTIVLDVGLSTRPGVIDHHHPEAEAECAASLIIKHPGLVLDHIPPAPPGGTPAPLTLITHRFPDFDALTAIFLTLRLLETRSIDPAMEAMAAYAKIVDSSNLPISVDLASTPYAVLRAMFAGAQTSDEDSINRDRVAAGLRFMRFLHARAAEGADLLKSRSLFRGLDAFERAMDKVDKDAANYFSDLSHSVRFPLRLPAADGGEDLEVDGLAVANPRSFLLKEWARRDFENSLSGRGFGFVMSMFGDCRIIMGVDPAAKVHLRGLGPRLDALEALKRGALGRAPANSWYDGGCPFFGHRIVDSPQDGTFLDWKEVINAVRTFGKSRQAPSAI